MEIEVLTVREVTSLAGANPGKYRVRGQLEVARTKTARNGSPFVELRLVDGGGGGVTLRSWSDDAYFNTAQQLKQNAFVEISAWWYEKEGYGLEARDWSARALEAAEIDALLAGGGEERRRQDADFAEIGTRVAAMADPRLRALCEKFLDKLGDRFRRTAAARINHHARRGGLVEHVAQMMRTAAALADAYPAVNRDLLLAGVLFHDCGKLWENCYSDRGFSMPYSELGELLGHIPIGMELANKLWKDCLEDPGAADWATLEPPSDQVRLHLLHLIASHHGTLEFGSPVVPKTPEALLLHYVDNIDAKMEMITECYRSGNRAGGAVYDWVRPLGARPVDPLPAVLGDPAQTTPASADDNDGDPAQHQHYPDDEAGDEADGGTGGPGGGRAPEPD